MAHGKILPPAKCALARGNGTMQINTRMSGSWSIKSVGRRTIFGWRVALVLVLCGWLGALDARAASITATVDRPVITLGETVTLSLTVDGVQIGQPNLPALPNFQVVARGQSFVMDAARGTSVQTYTFQLAPSQVGDSVIPGFQIDAGGQPLRTQPIAVKVLKPGDAVAAPGATMPSSFLKLITSKPQLYVGEVGEIEVQVYFQEGRITQFPQLPADAGFTVGKWPQPSQTRVQLSNQVYNLVTFKLAITPVKAGGLTLGPATVVLLVPDKNRRADFFFGRPEQQVPMTAEKIVVQVLPIPEQNVPPTYAGAVGSFSLALTAGPTNVAVGDPITVRVQIRGRGALDAVRLSPQPDWNEFKSYPASSRIEGGDANNHSGTKLFEQVVVPERAGLKALPPLAFTYFDPEQRGFRTLTTAPVPINVGVATGVTTALPSLPGLTNATPAQPASDLAHIKPFLGPVTTSSLLIAHQAFLLVPLLPPLAWVGLVLLRRRHERLTNDPRLRRRSEVAQKVRDGLAELRTQAAAKNSEAFFGTVTRLLQEQIGERVNWPASSITEAVVTERLRPCGASAELCGAVWELFQMCNLARYAPVKSAEELSAVVPKLEVTLRALQQWEAKR